jgi:hypothetical protein
MMFVFYILLGYLIYRFITGFLIPVFKASRQIRRQFSDMQEQMQEQMQSRQQTSAPEPDSGKPKNQVGEYIEFEELKSK